MKKLCNICSAVLVAVSVVILGISAPLKLALAEEFDETTEEISDEIPELYIKAVNPGYTTERGSNVGEMIEIARKNADESISLAGASVGYTNSSRNKSVLLEFPEGSRMTGETILLRLASSPDSELANITYKKTIATDGALRLMRGEEVLDEVCWTGEEGCAKKFNTKEPTTLVRNLETGEWEHAKEYEPEFAPENYFAPEPEPSGEDGEDDEDDEAAGKGEAGTDDPPQCQGLQFSEILSYYETEKSEQFIEFYNPKAEEIWLDGCVVRYKNKEHVLSGMVVAEGYIAYYPSENGFALTKNPTSSNELTLIDVNGAEIDEMEYPNGQRKGASYALVGYDEAGEEIWRVTYAPTPAEPNNYREFKPCEEGKVLNEATGNCVKVATVEEKTCQAGYYLNPLTGRCNKVKTAATTTSECKEGYYRDPTTNRCRKIKENDGADYELAPTEYEESSSFVALYAVLGVVAVGGGYLIYEFRHEIGRGFRKLVGKMRKR